MFELTPVLFFCLAGLSLIAIELVVFQLSVIWLLFLGCGALIASALGWLLGWDDWTFLTATFAVASAALIIALYRPFKRWQDQPGPISGNDAIGQQVLLKTAISPGQEGRVVWSGTEWTAVLSDSEQEPLNAGDHAYIKEISGIRLTVSKQM